MKKLLNTLYITTPRTYLSLDGENIIAAKEMGIHGITLDQSDQIETYVNTYLEKTTC